MRHSTFWMNRWSAGLLGSGLVLACASHVAAQDNSEPATAAEIKPIPEDSSGVELPPIDQGGHSTVTTTESPETIIISETESADIVNSQTAVRWRGTCPPGRFWAQGEALYWWIDGQDVPPLLTASPAGTPQNQAGVIGAAGTQVLLGDSAINDNGQLGGRFQLGYWLDPCHTVGFQTGFFFLGARDDNATIGSADGQTILARPFFDANPTVNANSSQLVSFPNLLAGAFSLNSSTQLLGGDAHLRRRLSCASGPVCNSTLGSGIFEVRNLNCCRIDLIGGFRYMRLSDDVSLTENLTALQGGTATPGTTIGVLDQFSTENDFYGYDMGATASLYRGRWTFDVTGRVAIGATNSRVDINGQTVVTDPFGLQAVQPGGLLAQPTNIGHYERDQFAVLPQVNFNVGFWVTQHLRVYCGYTFLYLSNVARAGDQIDPVVNSSQIGGQTLVGTARPAFNFVDGDVWAQGINFGGEIRY